MDFKRGWFFSPDDDGIGGEPMPVEDGGVAPVTPTQGTPKDAPQVDFEAQLQKREADLNRMKSTFQRQISDLQRQYQEQKREYEEEIRKLRLTGLSDDERKEYETTLKLEEADRYRQEAEQYRQQVEEIQLANNYAQFFTEMGVPASSLIRDQGLDVLVQSGWDGIKEVMSAMKKELDALKSTSTKSQAQDTPKSPHQPITSTPGSPYSGPSWDDLIKQYGSEEAVYSKVERGELPTSVIPLR